MLPRLHRNAMAPVQPDMNRRLPLPVQNHCAEDTNLPASAPSSWRSNCCRRYDG